MKIFDLFNKKSESTSDNDKKNKSDIKELEIYSGMRVIVETPEGRLLFIGNLKLPKKNRAELYQYSETETCQDTNIEFLSNSAPVFVKMRGYNDRGRKAVFMEGKISFRQKHMWQVENLTVTKVENERSYPRMSTDIDVTITAQNGAETDERTGRLLNISVGGASICSEHRYYKGDRFLLKAKMVEDKPPFVSYCEVLRVVQKDVSRFEYGCQFLELTEADQEQIAQNMTQMAEHRN